MGVRHFGDITAITALGRPGSLSSGGTTRYIKYVSGEETPHYYSPTHRSITESTFGIVVYQEQMMEMARQIGGLSWEDVSTLRKATSKSMGDEFMNKFKDKFIEGAIKNGHSDSDSSELWDDIASSGSYSFNKSHAVGYGLVSYWVAWCKANYPLEFAVACLNSISDDNSASKLLRDMVSNEGVDYVAVDPQLSEVTWSTKGGRLIGGLTNIKGVGKVKAKTIIQSRKTASPLAPGLKKLLTNPKTPFDIIFTAEHYWGFLYQDPKSHGLHEKPERIIDIDGRGKYVLLGKLIEKNIDEDIIKIKLEDDTDEIRCRIDTRHVQVSDKFLVEDDWYLVMGRIRSDWRSVSVENILNLNTHFDVLTKN